MPIWAEKIRRQAWPQDRAGVRDSGSFQSLGREAAVSACKPDRDLYNVPKDVDKSAKKWNLKTADLQEFVNKHIQKSSTIQCDGYASYKKLTDVLCQPKVYDSANGDLKWVHTVIANLKAFLLGTYHGRCTAWQSYFDKFMFRFNCRRFTKDLFQIFTRAAATSYRLLS